jgi:hypothetical protein
MSLTSSTTTTTASPATARDPQQQPSLDDRTGGGPGTPGHGQRAPAWRFALVAVLSLALVAGTRFAAQRMRSPVVAAGTTGATTTSLSSMNSFALALLLGGLRGPLVMILWTSSETQKSEKNLEDFDTKVEWIRLLQPEFDTVHIFQIWNKAYNISVQMASLANKYTTILDAIKYARDVDAERPHNINIVHAIGGVYYDKLGSAQEKVYYRKRVREETLPHAAKQKLRKGDPGWRPLEHEVMLDTDFRILPQFREEMKYITKYEPYPGGLSPLAIGYNYFKETQRLLREGKQRHAQLSEQVVDSRPALALRGWGEEEWERGRRVELAALGRPVDANTERVDMELPTSNLPLGQPVDPGALKPAIDSYDRAATLIGDAVGEYRIHLEEYKSNYNTYLSHLDHVLLTGYLVAGDRDYLKAMIASGDARPPLLRSAFDNYVRAVQQGEKLLLRYYMEDAWVPQVFGPFGPGVTRENFAERLTAQQISQAAARLQQVVQQQQYDTAEEDRGEYERYIVRAAARLQQLQGQVK